MTTQGFDQAQRALVFTHAITEMQLRTLHAHVLEVVAQRAAEELSREFIKAFGLDILADINRDALRQQVEAKVIEKLVQAVQP